MARFYIPPEKWDASCWELEGDEAKHGVKVLRLREGDTCTVFDGRGHARLALIGTVLGSRLIQLIPGDTLNTPNRDIPELTLCQSIPKGSNMDWIIQKAVELGVSRIQPLMTERTIARTDAEEALAKQAKWQRVALEACKQCGQNLLPQVETPLTFKTWFKECVPALPELKIIASLAPGSRPMRDCLEEARAEGKFAAAYLVGPEGDFTPTETEAALASGFLPISLGSIVLRVETATFLGLSALRYALDK